MSVPQPIGSEDPGPQSSEPDDFTGDDLGPLEDPGNDPKTLPVDLNELHREGTRRRIVWLVLIVLALQLPIALIAVGLHVDTGTVKDLLSLTLVPIAAIATAIAFSYFK